MGWLVSFVGVGEVRGTDTMSESRSHTNGNGSPLSGLPPWVRAVAVVGTPSVIAIYLIVVLTGALAHRVDAIDVRLTAHAEVTTRAAEQLRTLITDQERSTGQMLELMRRICLNTARNDTERSACLNVMRDQGR